MENTSQAKDMCFLCEKIIEKRKILHLQLPLHGECFERFTCALSAFNWKQQHPEYISPDYPFLNQTSLLSEKEFILKYRALNLTNSLSKDIESSRAKQENI